MAACEGYIYGSGGNLGAPTVQSFDSTRAQRTVDGHARYQNLVLNGNAFCAANTAAVVFGASLTATGVSFHLSNPLGSGVNAVILKAVISVVTCTTAGAIGFAYNGLGALTTGVIHGTPGTIQGLKLGIPGAIGAGGGSGSKSQCYFDSAATLPATPVWLRPIGYVNVTALANAGSIIDEVAGEIILQPGTTLSIVGLTGVGTMIAGLSWEEIPAANN